MKTVHLRQKKQIILLKILNAYCLSVLSQIDIDSYVAAKKTPRDKLGILTAFMFSLSPFKPEEVKKSRVSVALLHWQCLLDLSHP